MSCNHGNLIPDEKQIDDESFNFRMAYVDAAGRIAVKVTWDMKDRLDKAVDSENRVSREVFEKTIMSLEPTFLDGYPDRLERLFNKLDPDKTGYIYPQKQLEWKDTIQL
jgi:hypothetical protein